ncbi:TVP38/TMEM64 family protein [Allobaculum mucilyticum]|uniref:TVP38/TMEM64 family protein n=1 Tax=Allobaculum mucilyticum TaxID=2834459 RepID=UPI001E4A995A|nr:VTT domain-containing protein [Allobaculum mucilyticum]UNT97295.1 VTT domain-containing protein [Allobaculum mucilyticum]
MKPDVSDSSNRQTPSASAGEKQTTDAEKAASQSSSATTSAAATAKTADESALKKGDAVRKRNQIISIVCGILFFVFLIWALRSGAFSDTDKIQKMIEQAGVFGPILFIAVSVFTSYIPIIPMGSMGSIGIVLFGPLMAFFYNTLTSYINCILAFWLARHYGTKMIYQIASPQTVQKYENMLTRSKRFELVFFIWMMMPVSPDLLLCMLAGLSSMKVSHFLFIILISRPFSSWCYSTGLLKVFTWIRNALHL